ncbi:MAG: hypothetical protein KDD53_02225, partial [Bdellovibrionales bacterium]|nr:hypothetical protein [Bdellovibrionales bacterium]
MKDFSKIRQLVAVIITIAELAGFDAIAQTPQSLPRISISDFEYQGAFRLPADDFGESNLNYSQGPIAFNPASNSIFIVGHTYDQAIAEFNIPAIVKSSTLTDLNMCDAPIQNFTSVLDSISGGNPQGIDRIGGIALISGPNGDELLVNGYEYYDAAADNSHTSFVIRDSSALNSSSIDGFFSFQGGAGHTTGWISEIPLAWQDLLGGSHITGDSSGIPIIGRTSVGPSAFSFSPLDVVGKSTQSGTIQTNTLLDFSLEHPLSSDLSNDSGTNDLWTHLSRAIFGFIVPGTRTYATIGFSGGHSSGVCYKCTQNDNNLCGGYCAPDAEDYSHYYWLWDLNDLLKVKQGTIESYEVTPYEYGEFPTPFTTQELGGGAFDADSGKLYLTVQRADTEQGQYANPPVVVVYKIGTTSSALEKIGRVGKRKFFCLKSDQSNQVKLQRAGKADKLVDPKKAIKMIR